MSTIYTIDMHEEGTAFPHYWERCVGSCHAAMLLRADLQEQIRRAHQEIGFTYLRFHGLFDSDMSVVIPPMMPGMGEEQISFFNIDRIFDFLIGIGMKPFVEIGFMPEALASGNTTGFYYKNNVTMPKDDAKWIRLIRLFIEHLEERYGKKEVRTWYFEVWNEPNLRFFFDGTMEDYWHLYEMTAKTIKEVDSKLKVGGPATSNNRWIPEFRHFCEEHHVPCDFISTHQYPSDDPLSSLGMNGPGKKGEMFTKEEKKKLLALPKEELAGMMAQYLQKENTNPRDILLQMAEKAKEEAGDLPLIYTEWNVGHYDTAYAAAGILTTIEQLAGIPKMYSYWCISDLFEEQGLHGIPFHNEFGLVNVYGVPKPAYRIFEALHQAGSWRLPVSASGEDASRTVGILALSDKEDESTTVFVWNHDIEEIDIREEEVILQLPEDAGRISIAEIDEDHTNPLRAWKELGEPLYPNETELAQIEAASCLRYAPLSDSQAKRSEDGSIRIPLTLPPESTVILRIRK